MTMANQENKKMVDKETDRFRREIAQNLKKLRTEKNFTQEYMAECLGYDYSSGYSTLETGKKYLSFEEAVKISEILKVPMERILNAADDAPTDSVIMEEGHPYGNQKRSSMNVSVTLTGDHMNLQNQIRLLEKVNEILANDSV